jgi:hypothetical protein
VVIYKDIERFNTGRCIKRGENVHGATNYGWLVLPVPWVNALFKLVPSASFTYISHCTKSAFPNVAESDNGKATSHHDM